LIGVVAMSVVFAAGARADEETPAGGNDVLAQKVSVVTNGAVDIRDLLPSLAAEAGLGLQMTSAVRGEVDVHLVDVPLQQALVALLDPLGLSYRVAAGVLSVHAPGMVSRWFTFDYPVTEREGRGDLQVSMSAEGSSGSGGSSGGGDGSGGEESQNRSRVSSSVTMSVWPGVMEALESIVFAGSDVGADQEQEEGLKALSLSDGSGRSLLVNPMAGLVLVTAEQDRVEKVAGFLRRLEESLQRQVAIEVRIMEVYLDEDTQTGIDWESITSGDAAVRQRTIGDNDFSDTFFQFTVDSAHLQGMLRAISTSGDLRTISSPRITTLNNQKAVVRVVTEDVFYEAQVQPAVISNGVGTEAVVNYTPRTVPVGVVLDVTPQVGSDGVITLNVHPTISDVVSVAVSPNQDTAPVLSIRELDTVGKVPDGQTLVIAGLITERRKLTRSGIPVLKDLPLLGYLFGKTRRQRVNIELVMLLTPTILDSDKIDEMAVTAASRFTPATR